MSARLARTALRSAARASAPSARIAPRRAMSSAAHGAPASSDKPWIVGATLVFLPAFLYLVSPSARKTEHLVHDDKHDFPTLKKHAEPVPEPEAAAEPVAAAAPVEEEPAAAPAQATTLMADDEGTVADVGASIAVAESANVPKANQTPEEQAENLEAAKAAPIDVAAPAATETTA